MATNPAAIYYGPSAMGDAQLLGSGLGPLTVLRQENARRQAEQARIARLRQQQEQADARNVVPLEANGWLPHNDELNAAVQEGYNQQKAIYADPKLSMFEKKQAALQIQSSLKQKADLSNEQNKAYQASLAIGKADKRYNTAAFQQAAYKAASAPLGQFDPSSLEAVGTNADYFNRDEVLKQFIKAESDKENQRFGTAAAPGGYGQTNSFNSDVFASKNGKQVFNADGSPAIRDINALLQRAHRDPFMAAILRDNSAKAQQAAGAGAMTAGGEQDYAPLTPEQQMGMAALPRAASAERINLANLVTDYGKVKSSSTQTYRAAPQGRSGGGAKTAVIEEADNLPQVPGVYNAQVQVPATLPVTSWLGENAGTLTGTMAQDGFAHYGKGVRPKLTKKDGTRIDVEANSFTPDGFSQDDGRGNFTYSKNKTPMAGSYGEPYKMLIDSKTKQLRYPKPGDNVEQLIRSGQAEYATQLEFNSHKNENYTADLTDLTDALMKERNADYKPKYKSRAQAEVKAREALQKGTARKLVHYNPTNALSVDRDTQTSKGRGFYKAFDEAVQAENARIRASTGPAKKVVDWDAKGPSQGTKANSTGIKTTGGKKVISW